jgi:hypothetical protein
MAFVVFLITRRKRGGNQLSKIPEFIQELTIDPPSLISAPPTTEIKKE